MCGHHLCGTCWRYLILESVDSGPTCLRRLCPAVGCTLVIPEEFVEKFCPEKLTKYRHFQLESFVAQNKVRKFCRPARLVCFDTETLERDWVRTTVLCVRVLIVFVLVLISFVTSLLLLHRTTQRDTLLSSTLHCTHCIVHLSYPTYWYSLPLLTPPLSSSTVSAPRPLTTALIPAAVELLSTRRETKREL